MANKFSVVGGGCSCFAWVLLILACGLPLFSGNTTDESLVGSGIWGYGTWLSGTLCERAEAADLACYTYVSYYDKIEVMGVEVEVEVPDYMKGAEAASCLAVLVGLVTVGLGFGGKWIPAAICAILTAIFALVPFAIWENKVCGTDSDTSGEDLKENECYRSWSYGFEVTAWLFYMFSAVIFCLGNRSE